MYAACDYYQDPSATGHSNVTLEINQGDVGSEDQSSFLAWYTNPHSEQGLAPTQYDPIGAYAVYGFSGVADGDTQADVAMWLGDRLVGASLDVPSAQLSDPGAAARKLLVVFADAYAPA